MKIEEAITILKTHNKWRRGAEMPMTDPKTLGEAIDTVVEQFPIWHKVADGDLPKDGQLVLISNPAIQFAIFKKVFSPVVRFGRKFEIDDARIFVGVDYWMEIPEIMED